jgi:hypothetical protein
MAANEWLSPLLKRLSLMLVLAALVVSQLACNRRKPSGDNAPVPSSQPSHVQSTKPSGSITVSVLTQYSPSEEIGDGAQDAEVVTVQLANTTLLDVRGRQMGDGDLKKLLNVFGETKRGLAVDIDVSDNESNTSISDLQDAIARIIKASREINGADLTLRVNVISRRFLSARKGEKVN